MRNKISIYSSTLVRLQHRAEIFKDQGEIQRHLLEGPPIILSELYQQILLANIKDERSMIFVDLSEQLAWFLF